jgi:hypothetical protein
MQLNTRLPEPLCLLGDELHLFLSLNDNYPIDRQIIDHPNVNLVLIWQQVINSEYHLTNRPPSVNLVLA